MELVPGAKLLDVAQRGESNHQYVVLEMQPPHPWVGRDLLLRVLQAEGVLARRYFFPGCHRCLPYAASARNPLPVTEKLLQRVIVLPTGPSIDDETIETIVDLVRFVVQHSDEISGIWEELHAQYATRPDLGVAGRPGTPSAAMRSNFT
jgi:dTDP-4-amino-4,6-dideoxygalactose transaminase